MQVDDADVIKAKAVQTKYKDIIKFMYFLNSSSHWNCYVHNLICWYKLLHLHLDPIVNECEHIYLFSIYKQQFDKQNAWFFFFFNFFSQQQSSVCRLTQMEQEIQQISFPTCLSFSDTL